MNTIVSNTGPLITLEGLSGGFDLLRKLYDRVLIPPAVLKEVSAPDHYPSGAAFLEQHSVVDFLIVQTPQQYLPDITNLDEGEVAAISLSYEQQLPLLIEERAGRNIAHRKGLRVSGIAGQVLVAYKRGLISFNRAQAFLDTMLKIARINREIHTLLCYELRKPTLDS